MKQETIMNRRSSAQKFWWMAGFFVAFFCFTNALKAAPQDDSFTYQAAQKEWTYVKFQAPEGEKLKQFEALLDKIQVNKPKVSDPNYNLWQAVTLSSYAQLKGGLTGLKRAKEAKQLLETTLEDNGQVGDGLGHAVLGALFARVPGWPVGFGSKEKALWHLKTAYAISPKSMDVNYYYGDYLADEHEILAAKFHLNEALNAPAKAYSDPVYVEGRKAEIKKALEKI